MNDKRILLEGFEQALVQGIADRFRFQGDGIYTGALVPGRHLFVQDLTEREDIGDTAAGFDPETEPAIVVYTDGGAGITPSSSSGSRHEWNLRVVLRLGVVLERAKALLEQLVRFLENLRGVRLGRHVLKGVFITTRPGVFKRAGDDQAYCSSTLKILGVAIPY